MKGHHRRGAFEQSAAPSPTAGFSTPMTSNTDTVGAMPSLGSQRSTPILDAAMQGVEGNATATAVDSAALEVASTAVLAVVNRAYAAYAAQTVPEILAQSAALGVQNARQVAYLLATAEHESHFGTPRYTRSESLVEDNNAYTQGANGT